LVQILQAKYGYTRERAQQEIDRRAKDYSARTEASPSSGTMIAESSALGARPADHGADGAQNKAEASSPATTAAHRITFDTSEPTLRELVTGLMHDAKKLLRQEVALATHQIRAELRKIMLAVMSLGFGVGIAASGGLLLILMLVHLLHALTALPLWACYGMVGGLFAVVGAVLLVLGKQKMVHIHLVPQKTAKTMQENVQWIKAQVTANGISRRGGQR
jgi:hypothetical protein